MKTMKFMHQHKDGYPIRDEELLSPFSIYTDTKKSERFLLIPKQEQEGIKDIFIIANEKVIKVYNKKNDRRLYRVIITMINCIGCKRFKPIEVSSIEHTTKYEISEHLKEIITYKATNL